MNERDQLNAFRRGVRVSGGHSLYATEQPCTAPCGFDRTLICVDDRDVVECSKCGRQREVACNFDEEYS